MSSAGLASAGDIPSAALIKAASEGNPVQVRQALASGAKIDAVDDQKRTALILAVAGNHIEIAKVLMEAGASINAQAVNLDTPWLLAGARGRTEILEMMLPRGPDLTIRNRFGGNALIPACERAHEAVKVLLRSKIDVNHINNLGWTCLLEVVILGDGGARHQEVTKLVLAAGANPNIADKDGVSPLTHARRKGQAEVAKLIEAGGGR